MFARCRFTVCALRWRRSAISLLERPCATSARTSRSRSLRGSAAPSTLAVVVAEDVALGGRRRRDRLPRAARALDAIGGPELGEAGERRARFEIGGVAFSQRAQHRGEIDAGVRGFEGRAAGGEERDGLLELRARRFEVAARLRQVSARRGGEGLHLLGRERTRRSFRAWPRRTAARSTSPVAQAARTTTHNAAT